MKKSGIIILTVFAILMSLLATFSILGETYKKQTNDVYELETINVIDENEHHTYNFKIEDKEYYVEEESVIVRYDFLQNENKWFVEKEEKTNMLNKTKKTIKLYLYVGLGGK